MTRSRYKWKKSEVKFKNQNTSTVEEKDGAIVVTINETVHIRDSVSITVGTSEKISEQATLDILKQLNILDKRNGNQILENNLTKATESYSEAMSSEYRVLIFKHLFNSLELATNSDGVNRTDSGFDSEVSSLSGASNSDIERWRRFYNRIKHVDRNTKEISSFEKGVKNIVGEINQIREIAEQVIHAKLKLL